MVEGHQPDLEFSVLRVEDSYRVRLPQPLLRRVSWIKGDKPIPGWLLLANPGRCRLLAAAEVDEDSSLRLLRERITAESRIPFTSALEFRDQVSMALAVRLLPIQITPPDPGWRLTLPRPIAAIMQVRPGESELAAGFIQNHIEFWTMETLRSAVSTPLADLL
jgi:hypothetical protein